MRGGFGCVWGLGGKSGAAVAVCGGLENGGKKGHPYPLGAACGSAWGF